MKKQPILTPINKFIALAAIAGLTTGCCNESSIPGLMQKLNSPVTRDRNEAALEIAKCGSKASKAVPRLSELLYDDSVGVQSSAAYALRKIDTPEAQAIMKRAEASRRRK